MATPTDVSFDAADRNSGNGSRSADEDWLDENSRIDDNKWTTSQTTFWPDDDDKKFSRLREVHDRFAGEDEEYNRKTSIRYGHIMNDVYTFANICELQQYQSKAVASIIKDTDISSNNYGGKSYETIILAVMSLIVDRDIENVDEYNNRLILQDSFRSLMDSVGVGSKDIRKTRQMVRERVDLHKHRPVSR
jgi:hypothetical protein